MHQCWSSIISFLYHLGICIEDFAFFNTIKVYKFDGILDIDSSRIYTPCRNCYLGKIALVLINMVKNGIDPNNNSGLSLLGVGKEEECMTSQQCGLL